MNGDLEKSIRSRRWVAEVIFVLAVGLGSPLLAQVPNDSPLLKEVTDLVTSRCKAVTTVHIVAEKLSPAPETLHRRTPEQVREAMIRYGATSASDSDRQMLYESFCHEVNPAKPAATKIEFYRDGPRTAELSDRVSYVIDQKVAVRFTPNQSEGIQANLRYPPGFRDALTFGAFSRELAIKAPETTFVRLQKAFVDDTDHIVLNWKDQEEEVVCEIAREDGIIRCLRSTTKEGASLTIQTGRIRSRDGIPFPAASGQFLFQAGQLSSVRLVAAKTIEVNARIDTNVFRVAAPGDSYFRDERKFRFDFEATEKLSAAFNVVDIVEFANKERERQEQEAASKRE